MTKIMKIDEFVRYDGTPGKAKIEKAARKYNFKKLGILASMNLEDDIKDMFNHFMDERVAAGKMPEANRAKFEKALRSYLDYVWDQDIKVSYNTFCDLYDYLANGNLINALYMVDDKTLA